MKWRQGKRGWGRVLVVVVGGFNNLQMKNNQFRSNAISSRGDGQTELQSCQSTPLLLKQRLRTAQHREQERLEKDGEITPKGGAVDGEPARI